MMRPECNINRKHKMINMQNVNTGFKEIRITYDEMKSEFIRILIKHNFKKEKAETLAEIFSRNSLDGIYSHGVNRFARFIQYVIDKNINIEAEPELKSSNGSIEQWDGHSGPGPLNALLCTQRSMEIAHKNGIGCVALSNTTHWMRPGYYGWNAAKKGFCFVAWTNTIPLMPPWGSSQKKLGNNPIVFAAPYNSSAIVLDMAMSQFSFGTMENYISRNELLPFEGGFDKNGNLTKNPKEIVESMRPLPIGYWKGAGMALLLDILAAILSGGLSTHEIAKRGVETGISQVYISFNISKLDNFPSISTTIDNIINDYLSSEPENDKTQILYPGQRVLETRSGNLAAGIPVNKILWDEILSL